MRFRYIRGLSAVALVGLGLTATGCNSAEETEIITTLQAALNNLQQNRALTEQFVRDIKATVNPSDPAYAEVMDSYQNARDRYDRFLDGVEEDKRADHSRSLHRSSALDVENATADFLADATSILKPSVNTRRIPFQRAVVIPENLQGTLQKLPRKAREKIIDDYDSQLRWRSWSQL